MKRLVAVFLSMSLLITACGTDAASIGSEAQDNSETTVNDDSQIVLEEIEDESNSEGASSESESIDVVANKSGDELDIAITGLDDENLLTYVENNIYQELVSQLGSEDYLIENVEAVYYPKEYIEALSSNAQSNKYFGYTSAELNEQFDGKKYVFTLGKDGQTVVTPMETLTDDLYVKALEDVVIGSGAILICVTVSVVATPAAPAVGMIFAAGASTGTTFALQSGAISFATAAIIKGYETESFEQAMRAGVEASAEGFKWNAIMGIAVGGAKTALALKGATGNGLTMNQAAKIQQESGYPLEIIKQFKSVEEYEVYKEAGLYTKMVNGKLALVRDIDLNYISELPNGEQVTNLVRMEMGYAPIDPATGKAYQLHHINQNMKGTLAILTESEHQGNSKILNLFGKESEIDRAAFDKIRKEFWQKFAASCLKG